ncbi:MAG TPA: TerB family tellurite resistance protein [Gammaproteobacteria bacterium]|nr:TerB family tellurite resistance protein [Gammaproteobacteria bacterium]
MLRKLQEFYNQLLKPESPSEIDSEHQLKLAATALMVEVMRVDDRKTDEEIETVVGAMMMKFSINRQEAETQLELATGELHDATDYYQFTSLINRGYGREQKLLIIEFLWKIAYADGVLDMHEEYVIRKVSDLLYVSHNDFIRLKEKVRNTG